MTTPHNVLGMAVKPVYLTDPMNSLPDTSQDEAPTDEPESLESTALENPDKNAQEHDWKKRYSDLRKVDAVKDSTINELKTQISTLTSEVISKKVAPVMPKTPEEFKVFQEKYPELAGMIMTAAMMVNTSSSSVIDQKLKQLEEVQNSIRADKGIAELKKYHSDFEEIKDDPRFHAWFMEQPLKVQDLIRSSDPRTIAKGLDMYKIETGIVKTAQQKAEAKKDATREVKVPSRVLIGDGQKRTYTEQEIHKMPMAEFEKNQADILLAQREGRISKS